MAHSDLQRTVWRAVCVLVAANAAIGYALLDGIPQIPLAIVGLALAVLLGLVLFDMGIEPASTSESGG